MAVKRERGVLGYQINKQELIDTMKARFD